MATETFVRQFAALDQFGVSNRIIEREHVESDPRFPDVKTPVFATAEGQPLKAHPDGRFELPDGRLLTPE